jgi:hypothetical protein
VLLDDVPRRKSELARLVPTPGVHVVARRDGQVVPKAGRRPDDGQAGDGFDLSGRVRGDEVAVAERATSSQQEKEKIIIFLVQCLEMGRTTRTTATVGLNAIPSALRAHSHSKSARDSRQKNYCKNAIYAGFDTGARISSLEI